MFFWQAGERTFDELPLEVLGHLRKDYGAAGAAQTAQTFIDPMRALTACHATNDGTRRF